MINLTKLLLASNVLVLAFFGGLRFHFWQIEALSDKLLGWSNAFAEASISEKPGAVVPHAGICAGSVG